MREPTAEEKAELLQREIQESLVQHRFESREKEIVAAPQLSPSPFETQTHWLTCCSNTVQNGS